MFEVLVHSYSANSAHYLQHNVSIYKNKLNEFIKTSIKKNIKDK